MEMSEGPVVGHAVAITPLTHFSSAAAPDRPDRPAHPAMCAAAIRHHRSSSSSTSAVSTVLRTSLVVASRAGGATLRLPGRLSGGAGRSGKGSNSVVQHCADAAAAAAALMLLLHHRTDEKYAHLTDKDIWDEAWCVSHSPMCWGWVWGLCFPKGLGGVTQGLGGVGVLAQSLPPTLQVQQQRCQRPVCALVCMCWQLLLSKCRYHLATADRESVSSACCVSACLRPRTLGRTWTNGCRAYEPRFGTEDNPILVPSLLSEFLWPFGCGVLTHAAGEALS